MEKCMFKGCDKSNKGGGRGLCMNHYVGWLQRVKRGKATWKELEEKGMVRRKLTQAEKNINQMHPHKTYKSREIA